MFDIEKVKVNETRKEANEKLHDRKNEKEKEVSPIDLNFIMSHSRSSLLASFQH